MHQSPKLRAQDKHWFTRQTGMTPGEYRKAFNPDAPKTAKVGRPSGSRKH